MSIKMVVFWNDAPRALVDIDQCFKGAYCLHDRSETIALMMEVIRSSEMFCEYLPCYTVKHHSTQPYFRFYSFIKLIL